MVSSFIFFIIISLEGVGIATPVRVTTVLVLPYGVESIGIACAARWNADGRERIPARFLSAVRRRVMRKVDRR